MADIISPLRDIVKAVIEDEKKGLSEPVEKKPIVKKAGSADYEASSSGGGGTRTEADAATREYYDEQLITSSDGLFQLAIQPIKWILSYIYI